MKTTGDNQAVVSCEFGLSGGNEGFSPVFGRFSGVEFDVCMSAGYCSVTLHECSIRTIRVKVVVVSRSPGDVVDAHLCSFCW